MPNLLTYCKQGKIHYVKLLHFCGSKSTAKAFLLIIIYVHIQALYNRVV